VTGTTGATTRPLRRDAARNRERVLAAAAEVFHEEGLAAGLEDVARRAGVGVGTVYRRFPDRAALLDALLVDLLEHYLDVAERVAALPDGEGLAAYLREAGEVQATARGCVLRLWTSPSSEPLHAQLRARVRSLLDDAKAHGTCRPDVTFEDVVAVLVALRGVREPRTDGLALDWRRHLETCLRGLRP